MLVMTGYLEMISSFIVFLHSHSSRLLPFPHDRWQDWAHAVGRCATRFATRQMQGTS